MNVGQFSLARRYRRLDIELEPADADARCAGDDAPRFDWLLLSFWVSYCAVYVATAWTVVRWVTLPVVGA